MTNYLIYVLAVFRLTRVLIYEDGPYDVVPRWKSLLKEQSSKNSTYDMVYKAFTCKYCLGVWMSLLMLIMPRVVVTILAISGGQYLLEDYLDWRDEK